MAFDKHDYLIAMYKQLQNGWIPPKEITAEEYILAKNGNCSDHLRGFIGFGCSFAGKWFGGFANSTKRNYCLNAHNSILKKMDKLQNVEFEVADYRELNPMGALIYCDPPYKGTTQYGFVGNFDSLEFWDVMREWSKNNIVVVSEYSAPDDFKIVWERKTKTDIKNKEGKTEARIERLFMYAV